MNTNKDYRLYFCENTQRNFLTLGYFGGGSINVSEAFKTATEFAEVAKVDIETVQIDEVNTSRRFKGFKVLFSIALDQKPAPKAESIKDVWVWLTD